jgi:hypothetical protein
MSPQDALAVMRDPTEQPDIRVGAAIALDEWYSRWDVTTRVAHPDRDEVDHFLANWKGDLPR